MKKLAFVLIVVVISSCNSRLEITKKYHSFGWNVSLEKNNKSDQSVVKNKPKQEVIISSNSEEPILNKENSLIKRDKLEGKNQINHEIEMVKIPELKIGNKKHSLTINENVNNIYKSKPIHKLEKKLKSEKHGDGSGALRTIGWIFIILGLIFILIISILLGALLCLLGLLFVIAGK